MEEKPSTSIKPYLDKLTLGVTRILGEWGCGRAAGARRGCRSFVMETARWREGPPPLRAGPDATACTSPRQLWGRAGPGGVGQAVPAREPAGSPGLRGPGGCGLRERRAAGRTPATRCLVGCVGISLLSGITELCFFYAQTQTSLFLASESAQNA